MAGSTSETPEFAALLAAEERHFWFRARNRVLARIVGRTVRGWEPGYRVLEVGCGNGNVLRMLERVCAGATLVGSELHEEGVENARRRVGCEVARADIYQLPFRDPFRLIGMFDVLEHLPDELGALRSLRAAATAGARLVLTVPAYQSLWSHVDEVAGHYRRYTPASLTTALNAAGWRVEYLSPFMLTLAPLMWSSRRWAALRNRRRKTDRTTRDLAVSELRVVPVLNPLLYGLLAMEAPFLAAGGRLPVGSSLIAVAAPMGTPATAVRAA